MSDAVLEATSDNFKELTAEGTVLVDVWGPQCAPCIALMPHIERMAEERKDLQVVKLEAPKARRVCMELQVMGLPAFLLFKDGKEIARNSDAEASIEAIEQWIDDSLESVEQPA